MTRTANLRNLLENLLRCSLSSSPVTRSTFSSETSLFPSSPKLTSSRIQIFFTKTDIISSCWHPWRENDVLTCQWQVNCCRVDRWHQRHVSRLRHPFPSPDYLWACFARQFFCLFPTMGSLVPGYLALILCLATQVKARIPFGHSINSSFNTLLAHLSLWTLFALQNFA